MYYMSFTQAHRVRNGCLYICPQCHEERYPEYPEPEESHWCVPCDRPMITFKGIAELFHDHKLTFLAMTGIMKDENCDKNRSVRTRT